MNNKSIALRHRLFVALTICFYALMGNLLYAQTQAVSNESTSNGTKTEISQEGKIDKAENGIIEPRLTAINQAIARIKSFSGKYPPETAPNPFRKGYRVMMQDVIGFDSYNFYTDDVKEGHTNEFKFSPSLDYNFGKGFGVGLGIDYDNSNTDFTNNNRIESSDWRVSAAASYGYHQDKFNLYGRLSANTGKLKSTFETPTGSSTNEADVMGYRISVGSPISHHRTPVFFVPRITYMHDNFEYSDGDITESFLQFLFDFVAYEDCDDEDKPFPTLYKKGNLIIDNYTKFAAQFGSSKTDYTNPVFGDEESNLSDVKLNGNGIYYIADYFAIGADVGIRFQSEKSEDNNFEWNGTSWKFIPQFTVNAPTTTSLKHLFLNVSAGIGGESSETKIGTNTSETKYNSFAFEAGVGYNIPLTKNVLLTFQGCYDIHTQEEKDSNIKFKEKGIDGSLRVRFAF